ncbi:unnamed protein product [Adineta steineri]|uniref:Uncharacterized protein n=1 Tax=Adineta steineri TaxID=433720 RepID=A0A814TSX4_9BILA|nr:unnamed protein product [Adineta steineri]CAF3643933.1 unnamed protein product [Adineta steineri]
MRTRRTTRQTTNDVDDDDSDNVIVETPIDEIRKKIESIEQEINRRFEQIDHDLDSLKTASEKTRAAECKEDERFLKLCHAVDYILEHTDNNYETLACREMTLSLLGQRSGRPFSGRTIRNRLICRRMKKWCLFNFLILFIVICMSIYGLHRSWCYLFVVVCLFGSLFSSIGLRKIYKIIDTIW